MKYQLSAFEFASAVNHGHQVPVESAQFAREIIREAGPGLPIKMTIERCRGLCRCPPTYLIERVQRDQKHK